MLKKFNSFMNVSIYYTVLFVVLGGLLVIFPEISLKSLAYTIAILLIFNGLVLVIGFNDKLIIIDTITVGVLSVIMGAILFIYPDLLSTSVSIIMGIWIIINSIFKLKVTDILKKSKIDSWLVTLLLSILMMMCGVTLVFRPEIGSLAITTIIGILIVIYSLSDMVGYVIFKKNINAICKEIFR